jgi:pSer/pThr/pTyr-binding forkhead associated (FHA) protein
LGSDECAECGHLNAGDARFCASCGALLKAREITTDHPMVQIDDLPGVVEVDRSAFGVHEGLFVVVQGAKAGARYALDSDLVTIGRHPRSDIFLDDVTVSRRHVEVRRDGARYWVRDVGSLNGTYLNRERVDEVEMSDGDELQVGKFKLVFVHGTAT